MKKNMIIKFVSSLILVTLALLTSVIIITATGLWHREDIIMKLFLAIAVGGAVHFGLFHYLINKKLNRIRELVSAPIISKLYIVIATIFLLLGVLTGLLMLRNGSYASGELLRVTMVYFTVTAYFFVSRFVIKRIKF